MAGKTKTDAANAQFRKVQRDEDAKRAMTEYEAEAVAVAAKTARLKALRLARDAEEQAKPKPAAVPKGKAVKKGKTAKAKPASLTDWLDGEKKEGRRG